MQLRQQMKKYTLLCSPHFKYWSSLSQVESESALGSVKDWEGKTKTQIFYEAEAK